MLKILLIISICAVCTAIPEEFKNLRGANAQDIFAQIKAHPEQAAKFSASSYSSRNGC